jgi:glycosyltransferase involved in cell wall biosynthesis
VGNLFSEVGFGLYNAVDVVIGCLDSRIARYQLNRLCMRAGKTWIDGSIENLTGTVRVYKPGVSCYECGLSREEFNNIMLRTGCADVVRTQTEHGRIATTPISASIVGALQVQEAMKLIHELRNRKISILMLGYRTDHFDHVVKEQAHDLHIFHRFKQVDKVHHSDLTAVCKMAEAVIIPNTERIRDLYKLINAQRSGALVICKDSPQAREFGGDGAIYYTDFEDGADKLSDVLEDSNKREALLKAARENTERFTSQVLADHMIHIYRSILMHRRLFKQ